MTLLQKTKQALRVRTNDYDETLETLIESAKIDLGIAGVVLPDTLDAVCETAIVTYVKLHFLGLSENEWDRLKASYDEQKAQLGMASVYTDWGN